MASHERARSGPSVDSRCIRHSRVDNLLTEVGKGNLEAFAALYDQMSQSVFTTGLLMGHGPGVAAEITHDVFLDVWRRAPRYDPGVRSGWAWVHGLALDALNGGGRAQRAVAARNAHDATRAVGAPSRGHHTVGRRG